MPEARGNLDKPDGPAVVQINVLGDNNVVYVGGNTGAVGVSRRPAPWRVRRARSGSWGRIWMWLVKLADRIAAAGHCIGAAVIVLLGPLGGA